MATINNTSKKNFALSFFVLAVFLLAGFFFIHSSSYLTPSPLPLIRRGVGERSGNIKYVKIGGKNIKVDLALTPSEQNQGLSGRSGLAENEGMLFIFDQPGKYPFWMKDMNFAIDIIWLAQSEGGDGGDAQVVYIKKNALPELYPETYSPGSSDPGAKYVLEVASGFSDKYKLQEGDQATFTY